MTLTSEERDILNYLKATPGAFYTGREIAKRASGKKAFLKNPDWAKTVLPNLVEKGLVEQDMAGHFRLYRPKQVEARGRKWISPQMARLLKKSEKDFSAEVVFELEEEDEEKKEG